MFAVRRSLFPLAIAGQLLFKTLSALSVHDGLTLAARFIAAGVVCGLVAGYARRLAPPPLQGRALAIVGVGRPIALSLGVPLGAWLAGLLDWPLVFWIMSTVATLLLVWVRPDVPDLPGQAQHQRLSVGRVLSIPGIRPVLLVLLLLSLSAFAGAALPLAICHGSPALVLAGVAIWGLTFCGAPMLLQTAPAASAGEHAEVAQSILVTIFNLAVAGGGLSGELIMDKVGVAILAWIVLPLAIIALVTVWQAGGHGFRAGRREG